MTRKEQIEQQLCENCISRQAVLDYIYNDLGLGDEEYGGYRMVIKRRIK